MKNLKFISKAQNTVLAGVGFALLLAVTSLSYAGSAVDELTARVKNYVQLYDFKDQAFDREAVEHFYKKDENFTAYDVAPPVGGYLGWDAYAVAWYEVMNKYTEVHFVMKDDLRVFTEGNVGWVSFSAVWNGITASGNEFSKDIRMTLVWVREGDDWVIVHEHASAPVLFSLPGGEEV
jgi:ketosteroid isomerase-like protein